MKIKLPSHQTVESIFRHHHNSLCLEKIYKIDLSVIGQGTGHLNLYVTVNRTQHFNLRIGVRNKKKAGRALQSEFDMLLLMPPGIGPRAFIVDMSCTHLPQPYSILEYLPGAVKDVWSIDDLKMHARTLARLRQHRFDRHGKIGYLTDERFDIVQRFEIELSYWHTHHPELFDIDAVQSLLPSIRRFVSDHDELFADLRTFAIVHGDLHPAHILFHDDHMYYIDWQWARIGDPAYDIATTGWDISSTPGMELTGERLDAFLDNYLMNDIDLTLRQRRDVWMVYDMFFSYLYFSLQSSAPSSANARLIEAYLTERYS